MLHYYVLTLSSPEHHDQLNKGLTGELGTFGKPQPKEALPRPPVWSRIPAEAIEQMRQLRETQQQT